MWHQKLFAIRRGIILISLFRLIYESMLQHPRLLDMLAKAEFMLRNYEGLEVSFLWKFEPPGFQAQ